MPFCNYNCCAGAQCSGVQGVTGPQGLPGTSTSTGATGAQGSTGYQGLTGSQGVTGITGSTGTELNVYSNLTSSNNYSMIGYISAPDNPSYGLYTFTFYFNGPLTSNNYSSLVVSYYNDPTAAP